MVDTKHPETTEHHVMRILQQDKRLSKYKLKLHHQNKFGIDIEATAKGYEDFGIEVESCEASWPSDAPYPPSWRKGFTVPTRKLKFYKTFPLSIFVKVNRSLTRAAVVPMSFVCAADTAVVGSHASSHFSNNEMYVIQEAEHPAICYCRVEDLPSVIDALFKSMAQIKRNAIKYSDGRPSFTKMKEKSNA